MFGFLFILSTFTIGFEIFLGVMALAGGCCVISEVLMIISIHVFEPIQAIPPLAKPQVVLIPSDGDQSSISVSATALSTTIAAEDTAAVSLLQLFADASRKPAFSSPWRTTPWAIIVRDLHALVVTILVVNLQYLPFLGILPVFLTAALPLVETLTHWFSACVVSEENGRLSITSFFPLSTFLLLLRHLLLHVLSRRLVCIHSLTPISRRCSVTCGDHGPCPPRGQALQRLVWLDLRSADLTLS